MVGAGGIGSEQLKNLVLMGLGEIHVVDLDTIDLSNLNRQFLFGRESIKRPKAIVAKEAASKFNPAVNIVAYHANIKDEKFSPRWFKEFDIVYNALDNLEARRHVNKMCLVAGVPMIESGTAGFEGQVQPILPGKTECYDCTPKPVAKTFAVCTIRSTPSLPVHCVVWAKSFLFPLLFEPAGGEEDGDAAFDSSAENNSAEELERLQTETAELAQLKAGVLEQGFVGRMFDKVFGTDIERLQTMSTLWKARKPPTALKYSEIQLPSDEAAKIAAQDQKPWSLGEDVAVFTHSFERLQQRLKEIRDAVGPTASISFDKDDEDTLDFVAAAANIRAHVFHISEKCKFELKQIAGNIIPAIATTNAIVAGLGAVQSLNVLAGRPQQLRNVFLSRLVDRVLSAEPLQDRTPGCVACGVSRAVIRTDPDKFTLGDLVDKVLKLDLGYDDDISIVTTDLVYDPDFDDNLSKTLSDLSIHDGAFITVVDECDSNARQNLELYVELDRDTDAYNLPSRPEFEPKAALPSSPAADNASDDDGLEVGPSPLKRKADEPAASDSKRTKLDDPAAEDVVELDDDDVVELD